MCIYWQRAAAGVGTIITGGATNIAAGGAIIQAGGAAISFIGDKPSQALVKNASDAVINKIPLLPGFIKTGIKKGIDFVADKTPDIRTCRSGSP